MPPQLRRRMVKAKIKFISLVPRGANLMSVIYKEDDPDQFELSLLTKEEMSDEGEILACVYAPDLVDAHGEAASRDVIKEAAYGYLREGGKIDIRHNDQAVPREDAYVAESFVIQKNDNRFAGMKDTSGKIVDVTDGWGVVLKIDNPELRKLYKSGAWQGVSMGGKAAFREVSIYEGTYKAPPTTPPSQGELTMDEKQITEIVAKTVNATLDAREAAAEKVAKEAADAKTAADAAAAKQTPEFEGDPSKPEDVQKHLAKISAAKVNWSDPEAVQKHLDGLKTETPATDADPEVAKLEKQLEDTQKALNAAKGGSNQSGNQPGLKIPEGKLSFEEEVAKGFEQAALSTVEAGVAKDVAEVEAPGFLL